MEAPCAQRIHDQLATIVNNLAREKLPDETMAAKYKLYKRTENYYKLISVEVNPSKWDKLKSETRSCTLEVSKHSNRVNQKFNCHGSGY